MLDAMAEYNASDTRQIRAALKRSKADRALDDGVLLALMTTQQGRAWMWRMIGRCHAFRTPYTGENNATNFQLGEQNIGLELIADLLRACPDQFIFMMREANDGGRTDDNDGHNRDRSDNGRDDSGAGDDAVERDDSGTADDYNGRGDPEDRTIQ